MNDSTNQQSARQALDNHSRLLELLEDLKVLETDRNPKLPSRDELSWCEFFKWIDTELEAKTKSDIKISDTVGVLKLSEDNDEYSLVTKKTIKKGDNIFAIHRKVMLSTETVMGNSSLHDFIKKDVIASSMQNVVLVLHLLNEYSKGQNSFWAPYLAILPKKILPVLTFDKANLNSLLASSHVFEALKIIRAIARQYSYFFKRLQKTNLPLIKDFTYKYYCWGVSIVCSRQNEIPSFDRKVCPSPVIHALIPILDMCNHNRTSNQAIFENNLSLLYGSRELNVYEEITINYGCRSSGEFYIHNGFVPEEVPFDVVPITISLSRDGLLFEAKSALLKTLNMPSYGRFRLTLNDYENRHRRDPHLTMFLIVYFLTEDELEFITKSDNPISIADEVYEYVQYNDAATDKSVKQENGSKLVPESLEILKVKEMKERLSLCIKDYLSKRASISIALIDRTMTEQKSLDPATSMMLKHEKSIYESYLINCSAN